MNHIEMIEPDNLHKLHTCTARYADGFAYFRAHYRAQNKVGAPVSRYIELRCETGAAPTWTYRTGYMYSEKPKFWSVPDTHTTLCPLFAECIAQAGYVAARKELDAIVSAASRVGISIA